MTARRHHESGSSSRPGTCDGERDICKRAGWLWRRLVIKIAGKSLAPAAGKQRAMWRAVALQRVRGRAWMCVVLVVLWEGAGASQPSRRQVLCLSQSLNSKLAQIAWTGPRCKGALPSCVTANASSRIIVVTAGSRCRISMARGTLDAGADCHRRRRHFSQHLTSATWQSGSPGNGRFSA